MTIAPVYRAWTAKAVEQRLLEAAETLMLCPYAHGPKAFGSSMPAPLRLQMDAYAPTTRRYRRKPGAAALDRMEECWAWINDLQDVQSRRLVYDWARTKCSSRGSLKELAARDGFSDRTLRREITRICGAIADRLNMLHTPNFAEAEKTPANPTSGKSCNAGYQHHWRATNARPQIDPKQKKTRFVPARIAGPRGRKTRPDGTDIDSDTGR